jgi:hypothetical protein
MIATWRSAAADTARMRAMAAPCVSCVPWEKFNRNTSTPAPMSARIVSSLSLEGPTVATILVCRIASGCRVPHLLIVT